MEQTLLQLLQSRTIVDCDTMDAEVPKSLGPFVDCTSNQAIAFNEIQKAKHARLVRESIQLAKTLATEFSSDATMAELAVEIAMVKLQLEMSHNVTGYVHVQTNPYFSYDTQKTVKGARRIVKMFKQLQSNFDISRICIKIPSTWEGLQACRILESTGTTTLATTLFVMEQVALAGEVGCHYIAPYVNELRVHFDAGFVDNNKAQKLCLEAQRYYEAIKIRTQVLPASLTSTAEIMELAGVHHITISPDLLRQLTATSATSLSTVSLFDQTPAAAIWQGGPFMNDEAGYRIAFTRGGKGEGERKLGQAINIFCDMQTSLEALMTRA